MVLQVKSNWTNRVYFVILYAQSCRRRTVKEISGVGTVQGENRGIRYLQCLELEARRPMIMQSVPPCWAHQKPRRHYSPHQLHSLKRNRPAAVHSSSPLPQVRSRSSNLSHEHARLVVVPLLLDVTSVSSATSSSAAAATASTVAACKEVGSAVCHVR